MIGRCLTFISPVGLSLKDRQLVVVFKDRPDERHTVPVEDLGMVIIDNPQVTVTVPLLNALAEQNVGVVFCNGKGIPDSMLWNLNANYNQCAVLNAQLSLDGRVKRKLWRQTVQCKIRNQMQLLDLAGKDGFKLKPYLKGTASEEGAEKMEGIAARVYFQQLFGEDFIRDRSQTGINAMLNYGYTILRAACVKALLGAGLFPALGLYHHHRANAFPLADDVMEPYRPFVDELVLSQWLNGSVELDRQVKAELTRVLYCDVRMGGLTRPLNIGLQMTAASVADCVKGDAANINYPSLDDL